MLVFGLTCFDLVVEVSYSAKRGDYMYKKCTKCHGAKQVTGLGMMVADCPDCAGVGYIKGVAVKKEAKDGGQEQDQAKDIKDNKKETVKKEPPKKEPKKRDAKKETKDPQRT